MTIQNTAYPVAWPPQFQYSISTSGLMLDATGERFAYTFVVPQDGVLEGFGFMMATSNIHAASVFRMALYDVDSTGLPTGSPTHWRDFDATTVNVEDARWWSVPTLTNDGTAGGTARTVARGEIIACVWEWQTWGGAGSINPRRYNNQAENLAFEPRVQTWNPTSSIWQANASDTPICALRYSTGYIANPRFSLPMLAVQDHTFNSGSTPDERGLKFTLPWEALVDGAYVLANPSGDGEVVLYDGSNTVIASGLLPAEIAASGNRWCRVDLRDPTTEARVTLSANATYRLVVKPTTTTNLTIRVAQYGHADVAALHPGGSAVCYTSRTDASSSWTDDTAYRPQMGLLLIGLHDGAGGGSPRIGSNLIGV